jgi:hypothetical protein
MPKRPSRFWAARVLSMCLAFVCSAVGAVMGAAAAEPAPFACSPDRVAVAPGGSVVLRAWAIPLGETNRGRAIRYHWDVRVGRLDGRGAEVRWALSDVRPGRYAAAVRLDDGRDPITAECIIRVIVTSEGGERGGGVPPAGVAVPLPTPPGGSIRARETGGAFLLPDRAETPGYGLYSYLLFGAPPTNGARERYRGTLEAYVGLIPDIAALEQYVPPAELNIAYVPVRAVPDRQAPPERFLADYDYARARSLLRLFPGGNREGPYIVSSLRPVGTAGQPALAPTPYLFQDLSKVPPHLVASWVKEFLNQAAQERFWEDRSTERFALKLRVTVGVLAAALPEVKNALDTWIAWVR